MQAPWESSWMLGIILIAFTIVIHAMGVVMIAIMLLRIKHLLVARAGGVRHRKSISIFMVGAVGVLLALLHGAEAAIWALAYLWVGALGSRADAILYSLDSMTTRGAAGVMLNEHWRLMGALEAADGMLLFGVSTAFVFAIIEQLLPMLVNRQRFDAPHQH